MRFNVPELRGPLDPVTRELFVLLHAAGPVVVVRAELPRRIAAPVVRLLHETVEETVMPIPFGFLQTLIRFFVPEFGCPRPPLPRLREVSLRADAVEVHHRDVVHRARVFLRRGFLVPCHRFSVMSCTFEITPVVVLGFTHPLRRRFQVPPRRRRRAFLYAEAVSMSVVVEHPEVVRGVRAALRRSFLPPRAREVVLACIFMPDGEGDLGVSVPQLRAPKEPLTCDLNVFLHAVGPFRVVT